MITNVTKYPGGWWQGDTDGQIQKWFPVNYTEEVITQQDGTQVVSRCVCECVCLCVCVCVCGCH